jgi:hypothetical protein
MLIWLTTMSTTLPWQGSGWRNTQKYYVTLWTRVNQMPTTCMADDSHWTRWKADWEVWQASSHCEHCKAIQSAQTSCILARYFLDLITAATKQKPTERSLSATRQKHNTYRHNFSVTLYLSFRNHPIMRNAGGHVPESMNHNLIITTVRVQCK